MASVSIPEWIFFDNDNCWYSMPTHGATRCVTPALNRERGPTVGVEENGLHRTLVREEGQAPGACRRSYRRRGVHRLAGVP